MADGDVQNPFRDNLVENIRDLLKLLLALNITNNNMLAEPAPVRKRTCASSMHRRTQRQERAQKDRRKTEAIVNDLSAVTRPIL